MTPDQFSQSAIAWLKAVSEVLAVAAPIVAGIVLWVKNEVSKLKAAGDKEQIVSSANSAAIRDIHQIVTDAPSLPNPAPLPSAIAEPKAP